MYCGGDIVRTDHTAWGLKSTYSNQSRTKRTSRKPNSVNLRTKEMKMKAPRH